MAAVQEFKKNRLYIDCILFKKKKHKKQYYSTKQRLNTYEKSACLAFLLKQDN